MGNHQAACSANITLQRPDRVFFEGETIEGSVHVNSDEVRKINGAYIVLRCKLSYFKLIDDTNMRLKRRQQYRSSLHEQKTFLSESNILPIGDSVFSFSLNTPCGLPPTLNISNCVEISYYLQVLVDVPMHIRTIKLALIDLTLLPLIKCQMNWLNSSITDLSYANEIPDKIDCRLEVGEDCKFGIGSLIPYTCHIGNIKAVTYDLKLRLVQYVAAFSNLYRKTLYQETHQLKSEGFESDEIECSGKFVLNRLIMAPSYHSEEHNITVSYIIECLTSVQSLANGKTFVAGKTFVPIFIHNDDVVNCHPNKH